MQKRIGLAAPWLEGNEGRYVRECLESGWISSNGPFVTRFERDFARYCGVRHGVATANGTAALHLILASIGIGPGDEVIVPALTFVATANAVTYTGARPVFADVSEITWCLDAAAVEGLINQRTRAIVAVHLFGHPADMDAIEAIAHRHGLAVIEDAAEAHGALYKGRPAGQLGRAAAFSFYGNKIITTGEGGMVLTDDEMLAARARILRDHGMSKERKYWHPVIGFNYRMTDLQAAVGVAQLEQIDIILAIKRRMAAWYARDLAQVPDVVLAPAMPWAVSACWMNSVLLPEALAGQRDAIALEMDREGIETRPFFHPLDALPPYARKMTRPVARSLSERGLTLPSDPHLAREDVRVAADALARAIERRTAAQEVSTQARAAAA